MGRQSTALAAALAAAATATTAIVLVRRHRAARCVTLTSRAEVVAAAARIGLAQRLAPVPAVVRLGAPVDAALETALIALHTVDLTLATRGLEGGVPRVPSLTSLTLARCGLTALPPSLAALPRLRALDLGANELTAVDGDVLGRLTGLQRLNLAANRLTTLPPSIGDLTELRVLGLRDNALRELPDEIGNLASLTELYVTNNRLTALPSTIAGCTSLVKLQASFNRLTTLPPALASLPRLEMVRVACCAIDSLPSALAAAPALAWLSLAGNPVAGAPPSPPHAPPPARVPASAVTAGLKKLGDGASGEVRVAVWAGGEVALKLFRADVSPDGAAADEAAVAAAVDHPALAKTLATLAAEEGDGREARAASPSSDDDGAAAPPPSSSPAPPAGLLLRVAPGRPLADKPRGEPRLLRCGWDRSTRLPPSAALRAAARLAGGMAALHAAGAAHGDVYAHNVLCDGAGEATLVDFGAAFFVPPPDAAAPPPPAFQAFDVRAFGILLQELAAVTRGRAARVLAREGARAAGGGPADRPSFAELEAGLRAEAARAGVVEV